MIEMKQEILTENTLGSLFWLKIQQAYPRTLNLMGRSQRNDNFIDKTFTVVADILLKILL